MTFALSHPVVRLCCSDSKKVQRREQLCTPCLKPTVYRAWARRLRFCSSRLLARVFRSSSSSSTPLANCRACWVLVGAGGGPQERKIEVTEVDPLRATEKPQRPGEEGDRDPVIKGRKEKEWATEIQFLPQITKKVGGNLGLWAGGKGRVQEGGRGPSLPAELLTQG